MFELVKNVITNKETTCKPKRTQPKISFCSIPHDVGILRTFQPNSNSTRSPYRTDLSCLDIMRIPWVICGRSSSHIFCQKRVRNSSGCQKSACKLLNNLLILIFCFIASITATISSQVLLVRGVSSFDMIFESTPRFFNCHGWRS